MKIKRLMKFIAFAVIFILLLIVVTNVTMEGETNNISILQQFYEAPANSLDAVYIGSSNCLEYWNSMVAWEQYGICVQPFSTTHNPFSNSEHFITEARKTQPDALYIVNVNSLYEGVTDKIMHSVVDSFPFSFEKLRMIWDMCDFGEVSVEDRIGYFLPIIRYHTRWDELKPKDFHPQEISHYKGTETRVKYVNLTENIAEKYHVTDEAGDLSEKQAAYTTRLLDYCDREHVNVLFVVVPQNKTVSLLKQFNAIKNMAEARGYPVLDLMDKTDEIHLDLTMDFQDRSHTNTHGAVKYSFYLSEYLIENYGFTDKRGLAEYSSWDEALKNYNELIAPYLLDIEHIPSANTAFTTVSEVRVSREENGAAITWQEAEGADGYLIYRKEKTDSAFTRIADTKDLDWLDPEPAGETEPIYTVVPYRGEETREYGSFDHQGVQASK